MSETKGTHARRDPGRLSRHFQDVGLPVVPAVQRDASDTGERSESRTMLWSPILRFEHGLPTWVLRVGEGVRCWREAVTDGGWSLVLAMVSLVLGTRAYIPSKLGR